MGVCLQRLELFGFQICVGVDFDNDFHGCWFTMFQLLRIVPESARKKLQIILFGPFFTIMTGTELKTLREQRQLTQRDLANLLDVTHPSIARWEAGQEIPGPMQKLLELFFNGIHPFTGKEQNGDTTVARLEFTVDEFLELQRIANRNGFDDIKAYIVWAIRKHLAETRTQNHPNVVPLRKDIDYKKLPDPPDEKAAESAK